MLSHCFLPIHFSPCIFGSCFLPWIGIVRGNKLTGLKKCPSVCNLDLAWRETRAGLPCTCWRSPIHLESVFSFVVSSASSLHILSRLSECAWISVFSLFPETKGLDSVIDILKRGLLPPPPHPNTQHMCPYPRGYHRLQISPRCEVGNTVFTGVLCGLPCLTEIISKSLLRSPSGRVNGHCQRNW